MATKELTALHKLSMAIISSAAGDQETDPIIRLMNARKLPPGARLRVFYSEFVQAQANMAKVQQLITDASGRMWALAAELEALRPKYIDLDTSMPSPADVARWRALSDEATWLDELAFKWKQQETSLQFRVNEAGLQWDRVYKDWKSILFVETGDMAYAPVVLVADADGKLWHPPEAYERAGVAATRAAIEA